MGVNIGQVMRYISHQSMANAYVDSAFSGYDHMVIDKYIKDPSKGFQAGEVISVSSNFHAANFKHETTKVNQKRPRKSANKSESEEPVEVPDGWPEDICYFYNRRRCYGRCTRSHVCAGEKKTR